MKVGRGHNWRYEAGDWTEKKVTPDKWEFQYSVVKRRKGRAPEGSGAPLGTAYSWYILAHEIVTKLDANSYTTEMAGRVNRPWSRSGRIDSSTRSSPRSRTAPNGQSLSPPEGAPPCAEARR